MTSFKNIEHLFFDLDHTLWDFDRNSKMAYQQIFEEENINLPLDKFIGVYEPLNLEYWRRFRESEITKENLRYSRLKDTFDACDFSVEDNLIYKMADLYLEYLPNYNHLFSNCKDVLKKLKSKYQLHIITNGFDKVQDQKMKNSGLEPYFKYVLTAETAGFKKPDPRIFEMAMDQTGAIPANSLMIGDSYEADILGAKTLDMATIWFNPNKEPARDGVVQVENLLELHSLLLP